MGKWVAGDVLDGALSVIAMADRMIALTGQPASFQAAISGGLAEAAMAPADYTMQSGAGTGRRIAIAGKSGATVTGSGIADHIALVDMADGKLLYVTTCPATSLAAGGSVSFDGWTVEIGAPA
ncbi:hypothetical protein FJQ54_15720 [Sandaracinobacter neustonicus]|uniref:Uncharacterized protein n=1 Tax=Sandaracinobacter neustonicus TaxID=1715348 RepID=A0A501XDS8_9SPHN|nr:hypothetical protein [Sandaracinobacter neustonicus]TPE58513.1 hypothetical protein FJQ54_15720 [Sandaracinobacter neustonicus]